MSEFEIPTGFYGSSRSSSKFGLKISDGDTIQINQPIRMLNIDTPEKSGSTFGNADTAQDNLNRSRNRIESGRFDGTLSQELMD